MRAPEAIQEIEKTTYVQEWFVGVQSFEGAIDSIMSAYSIPETERAEVVEWVREGVELFNSANDTEHWLPMPGEQNPTYRVNSISTGFLVGNLLAGDDGRADADACARNYKEALEDLLRAEYPGAEVTVSYQFAQGCIPAGLRTMVELSGEFTFERHQLEEEIARDIEELSERIAVEEWYVELFNQDFDDEYPNRPGSPGEKRREKNEKRCSTFG